MYSFVVGLWEEESRAVDFRTGNLLEPSILPIPAEHPEGRDDLAVSLNGGAQIEDKMSHLAADFFVLSHPHRSNTNDGAVPRLNRKDETDFVFEVTNLHAVL